MHPGLIRQTPLGKMHQKPLKEATSPLSLQRQSVKLKGDGYPRAYNSDAVGQHAAYTSEAKILPRNTHYRPERPPLTHKTPAYLRDSQFMTFQL